MRIKVGTKVKRVSLSIAAFLFIAWIAALLLNIDIYRKANIELNIFGPLLDAVLLMIIALVIFVLVAISSENVETPKKWVNTSLFVLGLGAIFFISFFYIVTFY